MPTLIRHPCHSFQTILLLNLLIAHVSAFGMRSKCTSLSPSAAAAAASRRFHSIERFWLRSQTLFPDNVKRITTTPKYASLSSLHSVMGRGNYGGISRTSLTRTNPFVSSPSTTTTCRALSNRPTIHHDDDDTPNFADSATVDSNTKAFVFLNKIRQSLCQDILPSVVMECDTTETGNNDGEKREANPPRCVVLLSISGGCDSVALLHSVMELVEPYTDDNKESKYPLYCFRCDPTKTTLPDPPNDSSSIMFLLELHVVHFDHCQRGQASDGDRELVEQLAQSMGLPFHCYYWHVHNDIEFSQEVARTWRISQLSQLLQSLQSEQNQQQQRVGGVILTAHHQDDSNETLLLKLLRGVHLSNLSGMDPLTTIRSNQGEQHQAMFGRPLLRVKKSDILEFLQARQYVWREDASNQSDKYLRNRVRNELMPLLTDLVGGDDSLQKRLDNIVQQSHELNEDILQRATAILDARASVSENYLMLSNDGNALDYIQKQAIFLWANQVMQGHLLPYDQFVRVCAQLTDHPDNRKWTVNGGGGWDVVRSGNSLQISFNGNIVNQDSMEQTVQWSTIVNGVEDASDAARSNNQLIISLPSDMVTNDAASSGLQFLLTKSNVDGLLFTPPWRKDSSPIKLREFLRGQKIPLHLRSTAQSIFAKKGSEEAQLVAVYVADGDRRWVVDARFTPGSSNQSRTLLLSW